MAKGRNKRGNGQGTLFKRSAGGCWTEAWYDHEGRRKTRSTGTTDRAAAQRILSKWVSDAALRRDGVIDASAEELTKQTRRPIEQHVDEYERFLKSKGSTPKHVAHMVGLIRRMIGNAKTPARIMEAIAQRRRGGASARTCNMDLRAIKGFSRWAMRDGRLASDPLASLSVTNAAADVRRQRRPLSRDEAARLFSVAVSSKPWRGMSGPDRAMLYRLAAGTGFRAGELRSLTPASFDLESARRR